MKKNIKIIAVIACITLLFTTSVLSTLAYLKSKDSVENTFTVGKVAITLDESKVDEYGVVTEEQTKVKNNNYKLIPGHLYIKDPVVHFLADSEASYIFVKIENGLSAIETGTTIEQQVLTNGWTKLDGQTDIYYKKVAATSINIDYPVFTSFQIDGEADIQRYADTNIIITAYAIQADGFSSAVDAFAKLND